MRSRVSDGATTSSTNPRRGGDAHRQVLGLVGGGQRVRVGARLDLAAARRARRPARAPMTPIRAPGQASVRVGSEVAGVHDDVRATVRLAERHGDPGDRGAAEGPQQRRAVAKDARRAPGLRPAGSRACRRARRAGCRSGRRGPRTTRPSPTTAASRQPPRCWGWLAITPTGAALDPAEADDEVARPARRELEQRAAVEQARGDLAHVVDAAVALGQHVARILAGRVGGRGQRQRVAARGRAGSASSSRTRSAACDVVAGDEVRDAVGAVDLAARRARSARSPRA